MYPLRTPEEYQYDSYSPSFDLAGGTPSGTFSHYENVEHTSQTTLAIQPLDPEDQPTNQIRFVLGCERTILLSQIEHSIYQLQRPIWLKVDQQNNSFLVTSFTFEVYGIGATITEATNEFASMLIDLYEELVDSQTALSRSLNHQLNRLRLLLSY